MGTNDTLVGIDIGGTKIAIGLADRNGTLLVDRKIPTQAELGPNVALGNIFLTIEEMLSKGDANLVSIGVGCPGPLDVEKGLVLSPANLRTWNRVPLVAKLQEHFNVPVAFDNDANAAAIGEYMFGAGKGCQSVFYVTISTGIGGGLVFNGELYHGVRNGAGEIGHTIVKPDGVQCNCGSIGCLETICSGTHISRRISERISNGEPSLLQDLIRGGHPLNTQTLIEAVIQNDTAACELWDETCRYLAIGLGNAVTLFAPEVVIIGGGIAAVGDLLLGPLRELIPEFVSMIPAEYIKIVPAALGQESGLYGAIALAKGEISISAGKYAA